MPSWPSAGVLDRRSPVPWNSVSPPCSRSRKLPQHTCHHRDGKAGANRAGRPVTHLSGTTVLLVRFAISVSPQDSPAWPHQLRLAGLFPFGRRSLFAGNIALRLRCGVAPGCRGSPPWLAARRLIRFYPISDKPRSAPSSRMCW
ncbi:hypothetical protein BOSEA31B_10603 [Hyphomicrobiales bacterium]|nr:hypothetical protein BOSEA31B_10603 [Hyphomicrobiales bacterium]